MTTQTKKENQRPGDKPTHSLYAKSDQFTNPFNVRIASMWNNPEKGYMGIRLEQLELRENPNAKGDEPKYQMFVNTKIYGQPQLLKVADLVENEAKDGFNVNFGDMVAFENKPREALEEKKTTTNGQPRP